MFFLLFFLIMKRAYYLILLFCLLPKTSHAFDILGLQPVAPNGVFSTFSTDSLPRNRASFEVGFERSQDPDLDRFVLKGAYGFTDSIELDFTLPYVYDFLGSIDGLEDVAFGLKHRFYDEGKYGPSLAYILNASIPSGREEFTTHGQFGGGLVISKRVGPFEGHLNIFFEKPGTGTLRNEILFSGGLEFSAAHNFKLLGEFIAEKSHFSNHYDRLETRLGYRIKTTNFIDTTLGFGFGMDKRKPEVRILLSAAFTSLREKRNIKTIYEEE